MAALIAGTGIVSAAITVPPVVIDTSTTVPKPIVIETTEPIITIPAPIDSPTTLVTPTPTLTAVVIPPSLILRPPASPQKDTVTVGGSVEPGTAGATITRVNWNWGDGVVEDHGFPNTHTYAQLGSYTIIVTAFQSDGQSATMSATIFVTGPTETPTSPTTTIPTPRPFTPTPTPIPYVPPSGDPPIIVLNPVMVNMGTIVIVGSIQPGSSVGIIDAVIWDWGDGVRETVNTLPVTHAYPEDGMYTIGVEAIQSELGAPERRSSTTASTRVDTSKDPASFAPAPFVTKSPHAQASPKVVAERTADIDPGMTPYSGPTAPPTTPDPQPVGTAVAATMASSSDPPAMSAGDAVTASITTTSVAVQPATTTIAPQPATDASSRGTTAASAESSSLVLYAMGALLAAFGLVVGGIAYRSYTSRRDAPVEVMSGASYPASASIAPVLVGDGTQAPWVGYSPLTSDSYDLLARLRRYEDGARQTGLGATVPLADRLDLSLVPTLPIPAEVKELGPSVGCRALSVDHLGNAVCLRDQGTATERLDVVKIEEILRLIKERYEQRWVPRKSGAG